MKVILKDDEGVYATLNNGIVTKVVRNIKFSGLQYGLSPENAVKKEVRTLGILRNIEGIQQLYSYIPKKPVLKTHFIEGFSLNDKDLELPKDFFPKLEKLIIECEKRGIYRIGANHSDYIIDNGGNPNIIDFGNVILEDDLYALKPIISIAKIIIEKQFNFLKKQFNSR